MPCSNNPVWKHGLFYHAPIAEAAPIDHSDSTRVPCLYCGAMMLSNTAKRTGGFCMPHSGHAANFLDTLGGSPVYEEALSQAKIIDALINRESKLALGVLFSIMEPSDTLRLFSVKPQGAAPLIAARGVALLRGDHCITGFVTEWRPNPGYSSDQEFICDEPEIAGAFGDEWAAIKSELPAGAEFVRFSTSPRSWASLCGRAGYAVKVNGEYRWHVITTLN